MASLVEQIFGQIQAGSAQGQGFGDFYAKGKQLGQEERRINLAEQRLQAELAQLPLQQTLMQQDAKKNELELTGQLQARQNYLDSSQAFTSLSAQVGEHLKSGRLNDAMKELALGGLSNNFLLNDPRYKALGDQLMQMQEAADRAKYQKELAEARMTTADAAKLRAQATEKGLGLSEKRLELGVRNAELREEELRHRIGEAQRRLNPVRRAEMQAKLKAIEDDLSLMNNRERKNQLIEEVARQYEGAGGTPTKLRWTPNGFVPVE